MKKSKFFNDKSFRDLAKQISDQVKRNKGSFEDQKEEVELLLKLELRFKDRMFSRHPLRFYESYKEFVRFIVEENKNILTAQPYFRESSQKFKEISKCLQRCDIENLMKFHPNFLLINFLVEKIKEKEGGIPFEIEQLHKQIYDARNRLAENNLPLALNQALKFYRKVKTPIDINQFVSICTCGLLSGIDKFVGDYTPVWRSVCIGRMVGFMIQENSETFLQIYPSDKKILYRANIVINRNKVDKSDIPKITALVNQSFVEDKKNGMAVPKAKITEETIAYLINSTDFSNMSEDSDLDGIIEDQKGPSFFAGQKNREENLIEDNLERKDLLQKIYSQSKNLSIIEKKVLKMKGVQI